MCCILWSACCHTYAQDSKNLDVTATLFRPTDEPEKNAGAAIFSYPEIKVPANVSSVTDLLNASHILADSDAIGLMYELNPSLSEINSLVPGQSLRMVQVELSADAA